MPHRGLRRQGRGGALGRVALGRLALALLVSCVGAPLAAQPPGRPPSTETPSTETLTTETLSTETPPSERPRLGVALGGGSAKGLAHIGVLAVLEEAGYAPDLVAGTSMGAVVGGLYAAGWGPTALDSLARALDWGSAFSDGAERQDQLFAQRTDAPPRSVRVPLSGSLPIGLLEGQGVTALLTRLTWSRRHVRDFARLDVSFVAVAADVATGEAVPITGGTSLPTAIRASLSLPSIFAPTRLDGRLLTDGGLVRNLPAQDARALGAQVLVCVDVSDVPESAESLSSLASVLSQSITIALGPSAERQRERCDVVVRPDLDGLGSTDFDQAEALIQSGRDAALAALPQLRTLLAAAPPPAVGRRPADRPAVVCEVAVEGAVRVSEPLVRSLLRLPDPLGAPLRLGPGDIEAWTRRLHGTGAYRTVSYRTDAHRTDALADCERLTVVLDERTGGALGLAFRADSERRVALLLSASVPIHLAGLPVDAVVRFRAGRDAQARAALYGPLGRSASLAWRAFVDYREGPAFARLGDAAERFRGEAVRAEGGVLLVESRRLGLGVSLGAEHGWTDGAPDAVRQTVPDAVRPRTFASAALTGLVDVLDRQASPRTGLYARARVEHAVGVAAGARSFSQATLVARGYVPVARPAVGDVVLVLRAVAGHATAGAPAHRLYGLGGVGIAPATSPRLFDFAGVGAEALVGSSVAVAGAALRLDAGGRELAVQADLGTARDGWDWTPFWRDLTWGWAATVSQSTPAGPLALTVGGGERNRLRVQVAVGVPF